MNFELFVKLIHVICAIALISGLTGRELTRAWARKAKDIAGFNSFIELSIKFENLFVKPGTFLVLLTGIVISLMQGWPLLGFIQGFSSNWLLTSLIIYLLSVPLIVFVFQPRGKIFRESLNDALAQNKITDELTLAFNDKIIRTAHITELILIIAIIYLMVVKPF